MTDDQLRQLFGYQAPTVAQTKSCVALRTAFFNLGRLLVANTPDSRGQEVALEALQQASWAALAAVVDGTVPDPSSLP